MSDVIDGADPLDRAAELQALVEEALYIDADTEVSACEDGVSGAPLVTLTETAVMRLVEIAKSSGLAYVSPPCTGYAGRKP